MIELRVLGPLDLRSADGQPLPSVLSQPKRAAFLGYLALATPRGVHRRDSLLALFWPELDQEHARTALRQALHFLRKELGDETFVSHGDDVGLNPDRIRCDAVAMEAALDEGRAREAVELYRGDLLVGVHVRETPAFEQWLDGERSRLRHRAFEAGWALAAVEEGAANRAGAAHWAQWAATLLPDDESSVRRLIELLDRLGDRPGAIRAYDTLARLLATDYQLEPAPETRGLIETVRQRSPRPHDNRPETPPPEPPRRRVGGLSQRTTAAAGLALVLAGATALFALLQGGGPDSASAPPASIAVAYFKDLSPDSADAYLAAGLSEEVAASLGHVSQVLVKSPDAVRHAQRASGDDPQTLGRALSVRFLVEGTVRRAGKRIRVSVRLVNCATGFRAWGDDYDRLTADLLAIPEDIAREVAASITGAVSATQPRSIAVRPTSNVQAYDRFLEGNFLLAQRSPAAFTRAAAAYQEAVRLDPGFDRSLAKLAYTYGLMVTYAVRASGTPRDSLVDRGLTLADGVVRRNPGSSDGWMARGYLLSLRHPQTLEGVAEAFDRAITLDSMNVDALHEYGFILVISGRDSAAEASYLRALRVEPGRVNTLRHLGSLVSRRDLKRGLQLMDTAISIDPTFYAAYCDRARQRLFLRGDLAGSRADAEMGLRLRERPGCAAALALVELREGHPDRARDLVARYTSPPFDVNHGWMPLVLVELGDTGAALTLLERIQPRGAHLWHNLRGPEFDRLRREPRFQRVVETARPPGAPR